MDMLCQSLAAEMGQYADVDIEPMKGILGERAAAENGYIVVYIDGEWAGVMKVTPNPGREEYTRICSALHDSIMKWLKYYRPQPKKGKRINIGQL